MTQERLLLRAAENENRLRNVNEDVEAGRDPGDRTHRVGFVCECGADPCASLVELTPAEYEEIRRHARRFAVAPGHQQPELETVVRRETLFWVVEKHGDAGATAEDGDPRLRHDADR